MGQVLVTNSCVCHVVRSGQWLSVAIVAAVAVVAVVAGEVRQLRVVTNA